MLKKLAIPLTLVLFALAAQPRAMAADPESLSLDLGNNLAMNFVLIHAGTFQMGSPPDEKSRRPDELLHDVTIREDFYIATTPVTRGQFARFAAARNYRTEAETGTSGGYGIVVEAGAAKLTQRRDFTWKNPGFPQTDDHPVVLVTVKDANAFITWASQQTRKKLSLPSEAQFEYAARAGTTTRFYSGNNDTDADAIGWFKTNSDNTTHGVGEKAANAWGLYDMSGNVFQWCRDTYAAYQPGAPVVGDLNQSRDILRGGSFLRPLVDLRSAARYRNAPTSRNADNGFRLVMAITPPAPAIAPAAARTPIPQPEPPQIEPTTPTTQAPQAAPPIVPLGPPTAAADDFRITPHAQAEAYSVSTGRFGFVCALAPCLFILAVIAIIVTIIKRSRPSQPQQPQQPYPFNPNDPNINPNIPPPLPSQPRAVQDGFWIDTTRYNPGDRVRYRYQSPGGIVEDEFIVDPGNQGQFIYTGATPMNIILLGLAAAAVGQVFQQRPPQPPPPPPIPPRRANTGFSNFPSAY